MDVAWWILYHIRFVTIQRKPHYMKMVSGVLRPRRDRNLSCEYSHSGSVHVEDSPIDEDLPGDGANRSSDGLLLPLFIDIMQHWIRPSSCRSGPFFVSLYRASTQLHLTSSCTCLPLAYWFCANQRTYIQNVSLPLTCFIGTSNMA